MVLTNPSISLKKLLLMVILTVATCAAGGC